MQIVLQSHVIKFKCFTKLSVESHVTDFYTFIALEYSWMHHSNFSLFMHTLDNVHAESDSEV
jgi:hypothetical protein